MRRPTAPALKHQRTGSGAIYVKLSPSDASGLLIPKKLWPVQKADPLWSSQPRGRHPAWAGTL